MTRLSVAPTLLGMTSEPRGPRTRKRLLEASAQVFADRGYHSTRVEDIVTAAKTSHGTFYLYFTSKQEVFEVLIVQIVAELAKVADACPTLTVNQAVQEWLNKFDAVYKTNHAFLRTWIEAEIASDEIGRLGGGLVTRFTRALNERLHAAPSGLAPAPAAVILISMIERMEYYIHTQAIRATPAEAITTLAGVIAALVSPPALQSGS